MNAMENRIRIREYKIIPAGQLEVSPLQRSVHNSNKEKLVDSIMRLGFISPLVVVQKNGKYVIIDGQHRFIAGRELGMSEFPCVIVDDPELEKCLSIINRELAPNLKDLSEVAFEVFHLELSENPDKNESDALQGKIDEPCLVTFGFVYKQNPKFSGSIYHPVMKKVDWFLDVPLKDVKAIREKRAERLAKLDAEVSRICLALKEMGYHHQFIKQEVFGRINPFKGRNKAILEFDEAFDMMEAKLSSLSPNDIIQSASL